MPMVISLAMISFAGRFIFRANSLTVIVSMISILSGTEASCVSRFDFFLKLGLARRISEFSFQRLSGRRSRRSRSLFRDAPLLCCPRLSPPPCESGIPMPGAGICAGRPPASRCRSPRGRSVGLRGRSAAAAAEPRIRSPGPRKPPVDLAGPVPGVRERSLSLGERSGDEEPRGALGFRGAGDVCSASAPDLAALLAEAAFAAGAGFAGAGFLMTNFFFAGEASSSDLIFFLMSVATLGTGLMPASPSIFSTRIRVSAGMESATARLGRPARSIYAVISVVLMLYFFESSKTVIHYPLAR